MLIPFCYFVWCPDIRFVACVHRDSEHSSPVHLWLARLYDGPRPRLVFSIYSSSSLFVFPALLIRQLFSSFSQRLSPRSLVGWLVGWLAGWLAPKTCAALLSDGWIARVLRAVRVMAGLCCQVAVLLFFMLRNAPSMGFYSCLSSQILFRDATRIWSQWFGVYEGVRICVSMSMWRWIAYSKGVRLSLVPGE